MDWETQEVANSANAFLYDWGYHTYAIGFFECFLQQLAVPFQQSRKAKFLNYKRLG